MCKSRREGAKYAKKEAKKLPDDDFHLIFSSEAKLKTRAAVQKTAKAVQRGRIRRFFRLNIHSGGYKICAFF